MGIINIASENLLLNKKCNNCRFAYSIETKCYFIDNPLKTCKRWKDGKDIVVFIKKLKGIEFEI